MEAQCSLSVIFLSWVIKQYSRSFSCPFSRRFFPARAARREGNIVQDDAAELWEDPAEFNRTTTATSASEVAEFRRPSKSFEDPVVLSPTTPMSENTRVSPPSLHLDAAATAALEPSDTEENPNPFTSKLGTGGDVTPPLQPLPWESKVGYVIGPGELGLLNELQLPRRGTIVTLAPDFLRLPPVRSSQGIDSPLSLSPLMPIAKGSRDAPDQRGYGSGIPNLVHDVHSTTRGRGAHDEEIRDFLTGDDTESIKWTTSPDSDLESSSVAVPVAADLGVQEESISIDEVRRRPSLRLSVDAEESRLFRRSGRISHGYGFDPPAGRRHEVTPPGRTVVETASSADRIARLPTGTRFRVAVDKGVTGLGITVKEIRGRFFVYRLQALADGSPGAAEVCPAWILFF